MKYFILIDLTDDGSNNNCLMLEKTIDEALNDYFSDEIEKAKIVKECLLNSTPIPKECNIEYMVLDDTEISIPSSNHLILILENDKPYKFFGDYANYVLGLYAEDICAKHKSDVTDIEDECYEKPKFEKYVTLIDNTQMKLTGIHIDNTYF